MGKTSPGNCFEDFRIGQVIRHATPRTVTSGDVALYTALFGGRFAVQSSDEFAKAIGYPRAPIDDFLVFHMIFGKTGIVYVRTTGMKQDGTPVLEYVRWVMVRKNDEAAPAPGVHVHRMPTT